MMLFLVDLPAPVHGMSAINQSFLQCLQGQQIPIKVINTVPSYAAKYFGRLAWMPIKVMHSCLCFIGLICFCVSHPGSVVYRSVNGGVGQLFDFFYFTFCRLFRMRLYIHHHSFSYLNRRSRLFALINRIAGRDAIHIVLGEGMSERLTALYEIDHNRIRVQSNLAFFDLSESNEDTPPRQRLVIGHLANLTFEKGLDTFIEVCYHLDKNNLEFEALIAGPMANNEVKSLVDKVVNDLASVSYIGPLYGEDKLKFYQSLDAFIFPSKYVNEAEPLVLYEAATSGAMLVGTRRGCMQQVIKRLGGHSFCEGSSLAQEIVSILKQSQSELEFTAKQRNSRALQCQHVQSKAKQSLQNLIAEFKSVYVPKSE